MWFHVVQLNMTKEQKQRRSKRKSVWDINKEAKTVSFSLPGPSESLNKENTASSLLLLLNAICIITSVATPGTQTNNFQSDCGKTYY